MTNSTTWSEFAPPQCTPAGGRGDVPTRAALAMVKPHHDYLPQPRAAAAAAASTALGEVGGAQHPEGASTDGCLRLASSNSEGAGAEREGFEPSVGF